MSIRRLVIVESVYDDGDIIGANIRTHGMLPLMKVLGSSMPCSLVTPGKVNFFSVERIGNSRGIHEIDVLAVMFEGAGLVESFGQFIVVDWSKDKPFDLDRGLKLPWFRMAQIVNGRIDVRIDDVVFTTSLTAQHAKSGRRVYHVPDGDLLCAYLANHASAQDLYDHATQIQKEATEIEALNLEILGLRDRLDDYADLTEEIDSHKSHNDYLSAQIYDFNQQNVKLREEVADTVWRNEDLREMVLRLNEELNKFHAAARVWYERYDSLSSAVRARRIFAYFLRRMVNNLNSGEYHEWGRNITDDDVLSCLQEEE